MIRWFVLWYYALDVRLSFDSFTGLQVDPRIVEVGSYYWLMKKEFHVRLHDPAILIYYFSGKRKNNKRQKKKKSKNMMHIFQWSCDGMLTGLRRLHRLQKNMPTLHYSLNIQAHAHAKVGIWGPNRETSRWDQDFGSIWHLLLQYCCGIVACGMEVLDVEENAMGIR